MDPPVVAVAAEAREFAGLLRHAGELPRRPPMPLQFAREAEIARPSMAPGANGPGPRLARQAARAVRLTAARPASSSAPASAGRLTRTSRSAISSWRREVRGAKVYAALRAASVSDLRRMAPFDPSTAWPSRWRRSRRCGCDGAVAVEMEAAAVAEEAAGRHVPFYCVRVGHRYGRRRLCRWISIRCAMRTGRFSHAPHRLADCIASACPAGGLMRLGRQCRPRSAALGDFLADCGF